MKKRNKSLEVILVCLQVLTAAYLVLDTSWQRQEPLTLTIVTLAGCLAIWAIVVMQIDNLRIMPAPGSSARLVKKGPYKLIRHPMYSSLILLSVPIVITDFSYLRLSSCLMLLLLLLIKLHYEERLLCSRFPEYEAYTKTTWKLVPGIF